MNAGGHIAVAARALGQSRPNNRAGVLLGSALPDLATIGRFRLLGRTDDAEVSEGISLHHRTDEHFHRHPWFAVRNRELTAELAAAGLGRGAAMACSHVGIELLLDGRLIREPEITDANDVAFEAIQPRLDSLGPLVREDRIEDWLYHLERLSTLRLPADYHVAEAVAQRLYRILEARPRLALAEDKIDVVAEALGRRQDAIDSSALDLVDDLAAGLAAEIAAGLTTGLATEPTN